MNAYDLFVLLLCQSIAISVAALFVASRRPRFGLLVVALLATGSVVLATYYGARALDEANFLEQLLHDWRSRRSRTLLASLLGFSAATPWLVALLAWPRPKPASEDAPRPAADWPRDLVLACGLLGTTATLTVFGWNEMYRDWVGLRPAIPGFTVEVVAAFNFDPIRLAISDDDRVFVSADRSDNGFDIGMIYEIEPDALEGGLVRLVAEAPFLYRPYGLTAHDGSLYVSRSGHKVRLVRGKVEYEPTGAVTQFKDLDGDGYFEYAHDVLTGLPGSTGPDPQHQNNAVLFGPDGSLYATQGNPADRTPPAMPWEGKILRLPPGGSEPEIFARGFRNPFSLAFGPDGALFGIDNDVNANPGDELNHLLPGEHYGHPFVIADGQSPQEGFRDPVWIGPRESHLCGLAYSESPALPEPIRGSFLIGDVHQSRVFWLKLERHGDTYRAADHGVFATIRTPVDVAIRSSGEVLVLSRFARKLYRFRPQVPPSPESPSTAR